MAVFAARGKKLSAFLNTPHVDIYVLIGRTGIAVCVCAPRGQSKPETGLVCMMTIFQDIFPQELFDTMGSSATDDQVAWSLGCCEANCTDSR
jgi:hypothetical protein